MKPFGKSGWSVALSACVALALLASAGCQKGNESGGAAAANGATVYAANNCARCHRINGQGSPRGVDLSKVGAKQTTDWIVAHIKNPHQHSPQSRMPKFEGKIQDADLQALGAYLAGLK